MSALGDFGRVFGVGAAVTRLARVKSRPWWMSLLIGVGTAAAALIVRAALSGFYGDITGFMILLPAVIVAALASGRLAGTTSVLACLFGGWALVGLDTVGQGLTDRTGVVATANFLVIGLFVVAVASALRDKVGALDASLEDLRRSAARIDEGESRFRLVADSAPVQIWMTDADGEIVFVNKTYRAFFKVGNGQPPNWRVTVGKFDLGEAHDAFEQAMLRRERYEQVFQIQHPELGARWLRCEGIPRFDATGAFQGYVGANLDVTDAKRAEEDLKRINELLEERVGEALAEKAKAEADLMHAQRMEAVGRLTGGVAHDFNNLLTVVIGALDIMLRSPDDAAKRQKLGEAALAAARRGEGLTHQLLAFSRRQALRPEAVDLNAQIRESEPLCAGPSEKPSSSGSSSGAAGRGSTSIPPSSRPPC